MKLRLSRILLSILILSLALQTITLPALAQSEPNENQSISEDIPQELAVPYQRHSESDERPEYIPPSAEIIAKTQAQVNAFDCSTVTDVPQIDCEALVDFYDSTNGADWFIKSNWLQSTTVSNWFGITVENGRVTELRLPGNQLNGNIPSTLSNLSDLEFVFLTGNQLTGDIPAALGNLSELTYLNLNINQLTGNIPSTLGNLSKLTFLVLQRNQLTGGIPSTLGNLSKLTALNLSRTSLTGNIPLSFVNLTKLTSFYASETYLCEPATPEFLAWKNTVATWVGPGVCGAYLPLISR